jgi:hypothetical protein
MKVGSGVFVMVGDLDGMRVRVAVFVSVTVRVRVGVRYMGRVTMGTLVLVAPPGVGVARRLFQGGWVRMSALRGAMGVACCSQSI